MTAARALVIGLLGGVASGKSLVAEQLQRLGAGVLDADRAGHEALEEPGVRESVRNRWGERVFTSDDRVDRRAVAKIVFGSHDTARQELRFLEELTHPRIAVRLERQLADLSAAGKRVVVLDAPVMLKAGWQRLCDRIVFVDAPRNVRLERAKKRGWTAEEFVSREASQESLNIKRQHADCEIDNSGDLDATRAQVERLWRSLVG